MPQTLVVFYRDEDGTAPAYDSLEDLLRRGQRRAFAKCQVRIARLAERGFELRRPEADYLRDGIYELRVRSGRVQYRLLYFFFRRHTAVLSHLVKKEDRVPDAEIDRAVLYKARFEANPDTHTFLI